MKISSGELEDIYYEVEDSKFELIEITSDYSDEHRWFWNEEIVFKDKESDNIYSSPIMIPKSKSQDGQDLFYPEQDVWEVKKEITTTTKEAWVAV